MPASQNVATRPDPRLRREMAKIPGGLFQMGSDRHYREEAPMHRVRVDPFRMDTAPVTNLDFARFVGETGYVTVAERSLNPTEYPGASPDALLPGALVFRMTAGPVDMGDVRQWWHYVPGASWRHPEGSGSSVQGRWHHPVVQVSYDDALAFAKWAGKELPTEAEWEFAAWGGQAAEPESEFPWGGELNPGGWRMANTWQGVFPFQSLNGKPGTSSSGSFPANGYGLYDMIGNVWEWTADWYAARHEADPAKPCCTPSNPRGPSQAGSYDPRQPDISIPRRVVKGGSFLCAPSYSRRYRPPARQPQMLDTAMSHIGFRCIDRSPQ